MEKGKYVKATTLLLVLAGTLLIPATEGALSIRQTVQSGGAIVQGTLFPFASSTNLAKPGTPVSISGKILIIEDPSLTVEIQYSQDQVNWFQISAVKPNPDAAAPKPNTSLKYCGIQTMMPI